MKLLHCCASPKMIKVVMQKDAAKILADLKTRHLYREVRTITEVSGCRVRLAVADGTQEELINFSSNNYLGLTDHPRMKSAAIAATQKWGTGSGASRLITGSFFPHRELEDATARFKGAESALVFNSGYQANTTVIPALAGDDAVIFSDELNHASLIDGARLAKSTIKIFKHNDLKDLQDILALCAQSRKPGTRFIILSEAVFSMDGDIAPVPELLQLAKKHDATLYLDEAHSTGVLGASGRGVLEHFKLGQAHDHENLVLMGTYSKALGSFGAFVCSSKALCEFLVNKARGFIFSTSLPPSVVAASHEALAIIHDDPQIIWRLRENQNYFGGKLAHTVHTPIIPVIIGDEAKTLAVAEKMHEMGFWCQPIRPPTVPKGLSRIRLTITAQHKIEDLEELAGALKRLSII